MKNYAVLLAPDFRLQSVLRHQPELIDRPVALLEVEGAKSLVREFNSHAAVFHLYSGMTLTQALARCPDLQFINTNTGYERSAQDALLQTAENFSPFLESTAPGVVTLELPQEIIILPPALREKAIVPLFALGLAVQAGVATTPELALIAARFARPINIVEDPRAFLAPLPITALKPDEEMACVLESWGIHTVGQFVALPAAQVWERLGPGAVRLWEQATGERSRPLKLTKPQEFFAEEAELDHPVEMLEPLLFLLRRFLEQIATRLANAYLVAGKLRLVLRFERNEAYQRIFTLPQPTRDVTLLFRMLHTHLEGFTSESAIVGLELAAKPVRPQAEQFGLLERGLRDPHQFAETLARLQALLGPDAVGTPEIEPSHHPDAFRLRAYDLNSLAPTGEGDLLIGIPWLRLTPPVLANVVLNEERPAYLYSPRVTGPIHDARGPWQAEGQWWESRSWSREEWDIVTDGGMYRLVRTGEDWILAGIYA